MIMKKAVSLLLTIVLLLATLPLTTTALSNTTFVNSTTAASLLPSSYKKFVVNSTDNMNIFCSGEGFVFHGNGTVYPSHAVEMQNDAWVSFGVSNDDIYLNYDFEVLEGSAHLRLLVCGFDPACAPFPGVTLDINSLILGEYDPDLCGTDTFLGVGHYTGHIRLSDLHTDDPSAPYIDSRFLYDNTTAVISGFVLSVDGGIAVNDISIGKQTSYNTSSCLEYDLRSRLSSHGNAMLGAGGSSDSLVRAMSSWNKETDEADGAKASIGLYYSHVSDMYLHVGVRTEGPVRIYFLATTANGIRKINLCDVYGDTVKAVGAKTPQWLDGGWLPEGTYRICVPLCELYEPLGDDAQNADISGVYIESDRGTLYINRLKLTAQPTFFKYNFPDTPESAWYYDAVSYVSEREIMTGFKSGRFGAVNPLQRQDFVVTLARAANVDLSAYEGQTGNMKDVRADAYYAPAIAWAVKKGIITGYKSGNFGVGDNITREQIAAILHRFCNCPAVRISCWCGGGGYGGYCTSCGTPIGSVTSYLWKYPDYQKISGYAEYAMAWAVYHEILSGLNSGNISPQSAASRAQIAAIIMRMDQRGYF